ncbi:MAG: KEOPS complex subunit Cgi121 [Halobacteria archaeon]|nr:KEOPS complex subunit Cgi121 [Halobacteria archaeon]
MRIVEGTAEIDDVDSFLNRVNKIEERHETTIQGFDPRYLASERHLEEAYKKARRAFENGDNVARDFGIELMLYVAGTRQIERATEVGLKEGQGDIVFVVLDDEGVDDLTEIIDTKRVEYGSSEILKEFFDITGEEIKAVGEEKLELLVLERVALLDVRK